MIDRSHAAVVISVFHEEAESLDLRPGAPLIALRKTSIDTHGRVVEVADIVWPGDRLDMTYTTDLGRWA
jgi:GntR family transcriptional regulator